MPGEFRTAEHIAADAAARQERVAKRMSDGTLGGRSQAAAPPARLPDVLRSNQPGVGQVSAYAQLGTGVLTIATQAQNVGLPAGNHNYATPNFTLAGFSSYILGDQGADYFVVGTAADKANGRPFRTLRQCVISLHIAAHFAPNAVGYRGIRVVPSSGGTVDDREECPAMPANSVTRVRMTRVSLGEVDTPLNVSVHQSSGGDLAVQLFISMAVIAPIAF